LSSATAPGGASVGVGAESGNVHGLGRGRGLIWRRLGNTLARAQVRVRLRVTIGRYGKMARKSGMHMNATELIAAPSDTRKSQGVSHAAAASSSDRP